MTSIYKCGILKNLTLPQIIALLWEIDSNCQTVTIDMPCVMVFLLAIPVVVPGPVRSLAAARTHAAVAVPARSRAPVPAQRARAAALAPAAAPVPAPGIEVLSKYHNLYKDFVGV